MIKDSDLSTPGITLREFLEEVELRKEHGISLEGNLVTQNQEGVRIFTAHGSKGLEFHTVFIPFCLQDKNWPIERKLLLDWLGPIWLALKILPMPYGVEAPVLLFSWA